MMFKKYLFIFLLIISSCSKTPIKKNSTPTYSKEIEKSFENIEKLKAINSYRMLRLKNLRKIKKRRYSKKTKKRKSSRKKITNKFVRIKPKPKPKPKPKIIKPSYRKGDPAEIMTEVNQNLTYFCMKQRKNYKYKKLKDCQSYTQKQFSECKNKYSEEDNKGLIRCIKTRLRL